MAVFKVSKQAKELFDELIKEGIFAELEYWDGHKHVDIRIPDACLYIEVDGMHHFTQPKQIASDFMRDHYSDEDGYSTLRIPNQVVEEHMDQVTKAVSEIVLKRKKAK